MSEKDGPMTTRRLGAYLAVALIAGACGPGYGRATDEPIVAPPTPRIVYVTPAPTLAPTPTIAPEPTPEEDDA